MSKASGTKYVSKGERNSVDKRLLNALKQEVSGADRELNLQRAYWAGQNPWITYANPNKEQTNKRFIKMKANDLYGSPKSRMEKIFKLAGS